MLGQPSPVMVRYLSMRTQIAFFWQSTVFFSKSSVMRTVDFFNAQHTVSWYAVLRYRAHSQRMRSGHPHSEKYFQSPLSCAVYMSCAYSASLRFMQACALVRVADACVVNSHHG